MQKVYLAESLVDGQLLLDYLYHHDVPAEIFHQNAQGGLGDLAVTYPEVWIRHDSDLDKAKSLISNFENRQQSDKSHVCLTCGESSPDSFEICWQCHSLLT